MMSTSLCIRCGKKRIVEKSWTEVINNSKVIHTIMVCPDKECQKLVEEQLQRKKDKIASIREASDKRKKLNIRNKKLKRKR